VIETPTEHNVDEDLGMFVMLLRSHETHYERIGCLRDIDMYEQKEVIVRDSQGTLTLKECGFDYCSDKGRAQICNNPKLETFLLG